MKETADQWVVRLASDQVKGPYTTEALRNMIITGAFTGNEEVCPYPQGDWQIMTKQPEFYDALLESLENPSEYDNKKALKMEAETVIRASPPPPINKEPVSDHRSGTEKASSGEMPKFDLKEFVDNQIKSDEDEKARRTRAETPAAPKINAVALGKSIEQAQGRALATRQNRSVAPQGMPAFNPPPLVADIQMTDMKQLQKKEVKKMTPLILLAGLLIVAAVYLIFIDESSEKQNTGWTLLQLTRAEGNTVTAEQAKEYKRRAVAALQMANFEQLLVAQQDLIKAIEGTDRDLEAFGLLCMTYEQLWPFTKQTEQDLKSILTATQMVRTINPISKFSDTCQISYLLAKGQTREAKSLVEKTLDTSSDENFTLAPILYLVKAEMLDYESNFVNAEAYYNQAVKLWPQWITAQFGLARMQYKQNKFSEARDSYDKIMKDQPNSKIASYGLGLIETKTTKSDEKAISYFANGYKIKQKVLRDFNAEALLAYAKILNEKNDTKLALEVALTGYRLSPGNHDLKSLVVSLGGDEKVDGANSEIVLIGDQFARAGDNLTAQAQYKAAFEMDPKNGMAAYKAAKSLWQINQTRDAVVWLEKAIKADPKLLQAYVLKSDYESQRYNFTSASRTLALASSRFQQNHEVAKAMAQLEFRKNNMYATIQYGERALRIYDADAELLTLLAQAHIYIFMNAPSIRKDDQDRKDLAKKSARNYAGRAIDLEPAWPESQITYAKVLAAFDGPTRGETYLNDLIKAYPYTIEYRIALAEFYKQYEKFADAAKVYEEVVNIDAKNKKAAFGLAETYRILGKTELAQKYYNVTSSLDPSDVEAMFANAKLLIETAAGKEARAKNEQALAKLELVKKINPEFPKVSFFMARCYLELGNPQKAIEMVGEEKSRNPSIADSYILGAEIFYRSAQFKECAAEYSAALKLRPSSAELYVKAAICYRNSDAVDIAEDMLEMARERESGYPEIYRERGYISQKKGQRSEAIQNFKLYLSYSPNALDRNAIIKEVRNMGGVIE